jgi:two-component system sensor histidine kinase AlgZ
MRGIIRQKAEYPVLPDLRNLGTILRVLLAVNAAALAAAFAREQRWNALANEWIALTSYVEPYLLFELAILWLIGPWLSRQSYRTFVVAVVLVTIAAGIAVHMLIERLLPGQAGSFPRQLAFALAMAVALISYFRLRVKALSPAITEARLQALQARIRPHFLFNSINAVLSLVRSEPQRAETALEDLAELFRVLMRDNRDLTPLANEVLLCRQYLDLEKLRLGSRLIVDWNVKSMPGDALVPPLVLQPLLENAVYHGIEPSSEPAPCRSICSCRKAKSTRFSRIPFSPTAAVISRVTRWRSITCAKGSHCISMRSKPRIAHDQGRLRSAYTHALSNAEDRSDERRQGRNAASGKVQQWRASLARDAAPSWRRRCGGRPWLIPRSVY